MEDPTGASDVDIDSLMSSYATESACDDDEIVALQAQFEAELADFARSATEGLFGRQLCSSPAGSDSWADESFRVLGEGALVSNDTRKTGLNNNDLIIGPTGSGKTRSYIKPNLLQSALAPEENAPESFIITDTKGNLLHEVGPVLAACGYEVMSIDFANVERSTVGYNPLDFVDTDALTGQLHEQDVLRIAHTLCPVENGKDPFWDHAACTLV